MQIYEQTNSKTAQSVCVALMHSRAGCPRVCTAFCHSRLPLCSTKGTAKSSPAAMATRDSLLASSRRLFASGALFKPNMASQICRA